MKKYKLFDVFTPAQPASLTYIERDKVSKQLIRALKTPGKQVIVYGHSGSGKTTILKQKLVELELEKVTTRCMKGMSLADIIIDAFNQLNIYYQSSVESSNENKIGGGVSASYLGLKASLSGEKDSGIKSHSKRAVELPITPQTLATFFGEAKTAWIIEDFHKIDKDEKVKLSQIMKVFMDMADKHKSLKIIAIGAVNKARDVVHYDQEMRNRVSEIEVPLMKVSELEEIIRKGCKLLNIVIPEDVTEKIAIYSSGLASVTHQLALLICAEEDITETVKSKQVLDKKVLKKAIDNYISENSDTLKSVYDVAIKVRRTRKHESPTEILAAMLKNKKDNQTVREIATTMREKFNSYKETNLRKYLDELTTSERGEILRYDKTSDTFLFSTPFIKAYAYCMLYNESEDAIVTKAQLLKELKDTLKSEIEAAREQFIEDWSPDDLLD